jgi:glycosyltransferase involved in cell wall biosynthesis
MPPADSPSSLVTPVPGRLEPGGRPLKILQVFNRYLQPGGEEKSVARIASDLEAGGHQVTRFWRESEEWRRRGAPPRVRQPFLMWRNSAVLDELKRQHETVRADVWVLHNIIPVVSLDVYRLAGTLGVPIIQWLHNYRPFSPSGTLFAGETRLQPDDRWIAWKETWRGSWNGRWLTGWLALGYARLKRRGDFASVHAWVAVSEQMRQIFAQAGWFTDRLHTLRHSWHVQPAPSDGRDEGYFLFLGRMVEPKGVRFLIDLWKDPALRDLQLVMAGEGPLAAELRRQSPPNVRWVGHVEGEAKQQLKAGCRAIVFPSIWPEPLSTVAYEAYEMNKPILASNLGGMPEVVTHGETGFLLPAFGLNEWRQRIVQLAAEPAVSQRLGVAGRAWLEREVSPARWLGSFNTIARRALSS